MWALLAGTTLALAGDLSGYAEVRGQLSGGLEGRPRETAEVFRPTLEVQPHERVRLSMTVQAEWQQGRYRVEEGYALAEAQLGSVLEAAACSLDAPPRYDSADDLLGVERLYVDLYLPRVDVRVGRQALNWGSAQFFNPTDLFQQVFVAQPWAQRVGVDAIRATVPIGERHQVVGVAALTRDLSEGRFAVKGTVNALETDVSALAGATTAGDVYAGWDLRGQLVLGWWVEGRTSLTEPAPVVVAGLDYSVPVLDRLVFAGQYLYDATGLEDPALYTLAAKGLTVPMPDCLQDELEAEGVASGPQRFTIGRHYAMLYGQVAALDVLGGTVAAVMNLQDRSTLLVPTFTWTPGQAWSLNVGAQLPLGEGELSPGPLLTTIPLGPTRFDVSGLIPEWTAFAYVRYAL